MFQKEVKGTLNEGVAGTRASANPFSSDVRKAINSCAPGLFAWSSPDGDSFSPSGAGEPDVFLIRTNDMLITQYLSESQMIIPEGFNATGVYDGDWYARSTTSSVRKQKVFASVTTGEIATGAEGAAIAGFIETPWKVSYVASPGTAGSTIIISKH